MAKACALGILALISLLGPVLEIAIAGRVNPTGKFAIAEAVLSTLPIYYWYYIDKQQRRFRTGVLQNAGVIGVSVIAMSVYFFRSRGWKRAAASRLFWGRLFWAC